MALTEICMIRHGETNWNKEKRIQGNTDIPLNETGKSQAEVCCAAAKQFEPTVLITSPLARAKVTAEIINKDLRLPLHEMKAFVERSYGDAEGMTIEDRNRYFPDREDIPNVETFEDLKQRGLKGLEEVCERYPDERVLIVSHGALINSLLSVISKGELGTGITFLQNTSITKFAHENGEWRVIDYNNTDHLAAVNE
ncbi:histidine phosphatase family protein [Oceanobacillus jeddahense]|uniref:Histidine phosphatase family protein n=1 Tax=Oceanobacillus jeddahense TaxID=1462527 RepID=A0ABY5JXS1_9BACI|nr:histidine phosphatase family protein [Oceanobacillus jeddahense]UUI03851.1 histidine phosphatase family protein [Oceanobacillus jeddahense]